VQQTALMQARQMGRKSVGARSFNLRAPFVLTEDRASLYLQELFLP
jgi:hypothetical protein